ncbi:MAG: RidA family protein [Pigmentiphaga sp.]|nr:RidA family protein [Pigmentiphaga sp.]
MDIDTRLEHLGLRLPTGVTAAANYVPGILSGGHLFLSGQIPREDGRVAFRGKVGGEIGLESACQAAGLCALRLLAVARDMLGSLNGVRQVVELTVYVHATPDFQEPSAVADAASALFVELFGEAGRHARTAVCVAQLPQGAAVEIAAVLAVDAAS